MPILLEQLVSLFDEGLALSSEASGQEMHVMTHDAFVTLALKHDLLGKSPCRSQPTFRPHTPSCCSPALRPLWH